MTPASSDPLVAVLFALACRRFGPPVVLILPLERVEGLTKSENLLATEECEIAVAISPCEFAERAIMEVDVNVASDALRALGFSVPDAIPDVNALRDALHDSHMNGSRLTAVHVRSFVADLERRIQHRMNP